MDSRICEHLKGVEPEPVMEGVEPTPVMEAGLLNAPSTPSEADGMQRSTRLLRATSMAVAGLKTGQFRAEPSLLLLDPANFGHFVTWASDCGDAGRGSYAPAYRGRRSSGSVEATDAPTPPPAPESVAGGGSALASLTNDTSAASSSCASEEQQHGDGAGAGRKAQLCSLCGCAGRAGAACHSCW